MPFDNKYNMIKLIFLMLMWPAVAFSQTAMILEVSVRRIPVTVESGGQCIDQRVLFFTDGQIMGILTSTDTLQLKRLAVLVAEPGHSIILCYDELHGNQPYRVRYLEGRQGILMYITPFVPHSDEEVRVFHSVRVRQTQRILYGLVISTIPCN